MLTDEEAKAIRSLQNLAKKFPKTLSLFSNNGSLIVLKKHSDHPEEKQGRVVARILGISNDGGDFCFKEWNDKNGTGEGEN